MRSFRPLNWSKKAQKDTLIGLKLELGKVLSLNLKGRRAADRSHLLTRRAKRNHSFNWVSRNWPRIIRRRMRLIRRRWACWVTDMRKSSKGQRRRWSRVWLNKTTSELNQWQDTLADSKSMIRIINRQWFSTQVKMNSLTRLNTLPVPYLRILMCSIQ